MPEPPAPPMLPEPPQFTPCPSGWREAADERGIVRCDPWPAGGEQSCAEDEAHFPGERGGTRIGTACPAGDFPENLPTDVPIRYVRAGSTSGDGSGARPFATLREALAQSAAKTIVALARGTYDERIAIPAGVTVRSACVRETKIVWSGSFAFNQPQVLVLAAHTAVENLSIGPANAPGLVVVGPLADFDLRDVIILGAQGIAVQAESAATVTARSVVLRETRPDPSGNRGVGLGVISAARVAISRGVFARHQCDRRGYGESNQR